MPGLRVARWIVSRWSVDKLHEQNRFHIFSSFYYFDVGAYSTYILQYNIRAAAGQ